MVLGTLRSAHPKMGHILAFFDQKRQNLGDQLLGTKNTLKLKSVETKFALGLTRMLYTSFS
jgi:hypothetical protein